MPSYHSIFNDINYPSACGIPIIEFVTKLPDMDSNKLKVSMSEIDIDIIDEALIYFRANVLFKNFPIKGDADKLLIYITIFIQKCLETICNQEIDKAKALMKNLIDECEWIPNLKSHFLNSLVNLKNDEVVELQVFLKSVRKELVNRLQYLLYDSDYKTLDLKYWLGFAKKKFMGYDMPSIKK
jgi:actin related protein 2/3 complex subunit 3